MTIVRIVMGGSSIAAIVVDLRAFDDVARYASYKGFQIALELEEDAVTLPASIETQPTKVLEDQCVDACHDPWQNAASDGSCIAPYLRAFLMSTPVGRAALEEHGFLSADLGLK